MAWWGTCGRCFIIPVELCQRKKQPPVAHNAEREMTNMQPNTMQPAGLGRTNGFSALLAELKSFYCQQNSSPAVREGKESPFRAHTLVTHA